MLQKSCFKHVERLFTIFSDSVESSFWCRLILVKLNIFLIKISRTFSSYPKYFLNGRQATKYLLIQRNKFNFNFLKDRSTISMVAISVIMVLIMKNNKMSNNMGRIIPGENFLCGNFPGGSSPGGNFLGGSFLGVSFPGDNFPDTICNDYLEFCPWLTLYHLVDAEKKLRDLHKLDLTNFKNIFLKKKWLPSGSRWKRLVMNIIMLFPSSKAPISLSSDKNC